MRATLLLDNLLGKLSLLNHAVSAKAQLPILSGFLIVARKGRVEISATDLDVGVTVSVSAGVEEEGGVVVPAKPFSELLSSISEEKITIEKKGSSVGLVGKRLRASLLPMDEGEFPKIFEEKGEKLTSLKKDSLQKEFSRVVFAAAQDVSRPAFSAVYVKPHNKGLLIVATDSHRLSKSTTAPHTNGASTKPILVSARTIRALLSGKGDEDTDCFVSEKNNQIIFTRGDDVLVGRLIDAEYPDFEKIIPTDSSTRSEFDREEMQAALKAASVFARDNASIVKFSVKKDRISVFAKSPGLGENSVDVLAKTQGEENEIAFNGRYVMELLQNVEEETMVFEMTGPLNPGVFKIVNDDSFVHLIMPIRVREEEI